MTKKETQLEILRTYYKFMMYRNPAERLFSAYRDKVEKYPLLGSKGKEPHFNWLRKDIYKHSHPEEFKEWRDKGAKRAINISFPDFINYWVSEVGRKLIDHHLNYANL